MLDSDSESDDESEGVLGLDSDDMEIDETEPDAVAVATGIGRDHPYAWALDGRLAMPTDSMPGHVHVRLAAHYASSVASPPSVHTGNCYLARMFSRLVKEAVDLLKTPDAHNSANGVNPDEQALPVLKTNPEESATVLSMVSAKLEKSWRWLAGILDIVEGQLQMGRTFDTKRYLASLQRPEESELSFLTRSSPPVSGASPEEYLMFLLRAHSHEHSDSLPVMDMLCYEHTVYVLDAFIYAMNHWPKLPSDPSRSLSVSSVDLEEPVPSSSQSTEAGTSPSQPGLKHVGEKKRRRNLSKDSEMLVKFFEMDVLGSEKERFLNSLRDAVQHKFPKVPKATWEVFTHNVSVSRQKSVEDTAHARSTGNGEEPVLPVTHQELSSISYPVCLASNWSPDVVLTRWKISVDLFSRMFLADGPGAERDSFLAARAGVAGRLARFRRTVSHLRETLTNDAQQANLGFGGLGGRSGTTLSLSVKRTRILEDALRILGEMTTFHYCNFRAKFEGEEGSGPGVNRGFFAAVANSLKAEDKSSEGSFLLHEPGKLPEQSGFYAPKPFSGRGTAEEIADAKSRRHKMFTAIGRFIGISLWFNNTVPLNFSRPVIKYLLDRDVTWEDLAFFNADLFEGLSRMMLDAEHPMMTSECFQATYCCHFETTVGGTTEELISSGSQIAVTPENIHSYVSLYASKVMVGCVEDDLKAMSSGLHDVIPAELLTSLTPEDFQLLLSGGTTDVDVNRLRSVISFTNSNGCSVDILERFKRWFWSTVQKMTPLQRQQLLYFCTGSAVLPALSDRRDADQDFSITVDVISGNTKALPMATTCGQRMSIPLYPSRKVLKRKLLQAIQCQSYGLG